MDDDFLGSLIHFIHFFVDSEHLSIYVCSWSADSEVKEVNTSKLTLFAQVQIRRGEELKTSHLALFAHCW